MMTEEKPAPPKTTGGKRMGRPPQFAELTTVTLTFPPDLWDYCKSQPGGAAAFLRGLAEAHRQGKKKAK